MHARSERLIRGLGRRYATVLGIVAGLLLLDQAVLQPLLLRLHLDAPVINLAGRQRMLSQRLLKGSLAVAHYPTQAEEWRGELDRSLAQWSRAHAGLQHGDAELSLPGTSEPTIRAAFDRLEPHFQAIKEEVARVLASPSDAERSVQSLLKHERPYLETMDEIVRMFEAQSRRRVHWLRWLGIGLTTLALALMAALSRLVLRPATRHIREQVEFLEDRVAERTQELVESNTALAQEVEERQQAEERNRLLQSQLAHTTRVTSLGELATGIAHEINQPLGAITNYAEALEVLVEREPLDRAEIRKSALRLRDSALRAGQIVGRMRNFVRSKTSSRSPELINPLVLDVLALCEPELKLHQVAVACQLDESAGAEVEVDSIQIQQVLVNLISNAIQAMAPCPADARALTVRTCRTAAGVAVEVEDAGPGFPPGQLAQPFRPFCSTKKDGLGMGLSISQSMIAAHGGELTAENVFPHGARLSFVLPYSDDPAFRDTADRLCCG